MIRRRVQRWERAERERRYRDHPITVTTFIKGHETETRRLKP